MTAVNHARLTKWWRDDPSDPDRMLLNNPHAQKLIAEIAPDAKTTDLGGVMSLNVRIEPDELVLRVHQPFVSRSRLLAVQKLRYGCDNQGLIVPIPMYWNNAPLLRCQNRWAELEQFIPHERLNPSLDSYLWLFQAMGVLHRTLTRLHVAVPRPLVATYASPSTLRRWLQVNSIAVQDDSEAVITAELLNNLLRRLRSQWISTSELPTQLVHGDIRLSNVCQTLDGQRVYFDFGFAAHRPRIYDIAYALAFMVLTQGGHQAPNHYRWQDVGQLVNEYELAAHTRLTTLERKALAPYIASIPMYHAANVGFSNNPVKQLHEKSVLLRLSEWVLAHPEAIFE